MDAQQAQFFVDKYTGGIYKNNSNHLSSSSTHVFAKNRVGWDVTLPLSDLIPIPDTFKAYIKSDTVFHGLKGEYVVLSMGDLEVSDNFFDMRQDKNECLWFLGNAHGIRVWVPNGDIDFSTIKLIEDPIPSMPTLNELQKCTIEYEGRKTVVTYYDSFVGESICHPEDEFDIEVGISIAFDRAKKAKEDYDAKQAKTIKIGDAVRASDRGGIDCTTSPSPNLMKRLYDKTRNIDACLNFAHNSFPNKGRLFRVLYVDDFYGKAFIQEVSLYDNTHFVSLKDLEVVHSSEGDEYDGF